MELIVKTKIKRIYLVLFASGSEQFHSLAKAKRYAAALRRTGRICSVYEVVGVDTITGKLKMEER